MEERDPCSNRDLREHGTANTTLVPALQKVFPCHRQARFFSDLVTSSRHTHLSVRARAHTHSHRVLTHRSASVGRVAYAFRKATARC